MFVRCQLSRRSFTRHASYWGSKDSILFHTLSKLRLNPRFSNLLSYSVLADYYIFLLLEMKVKDTDKFRLGVRQKKFLCQQVFLRELNHVP